MMPAYIEKCAQNAILPPYHQHRLATNFSSNVLSGSSNLLGAPYHLPRAAEHGLALKLGYAVIGVPGTGNC